MRGQKIYVVAEAGVNHNGTLELARKLVDVAVDAGADAVKFQTFRAEEVAVKDAPVANYQLTACAQGESQFAMLKRLELSKDAHFSLADYCAKRGIQFLSTPFDFGSADFLIKELGLQRIKIASGDITTAPLLLHIARRDKPVILSTGMSTLGDIEAALGVLAFGYTKQAIEPSQEAFRRAYISSKGRKLLQDKVALMHCTSEYPAAFSNIHLHAMDTLRAAFGLPVGYSDHSQGIAIPLAAAARGAEIIEKHFTLDRNLPGPDHKASLEPDELKLMVQGIRQIEQALGEFHKVPTNEELGVSGVARKSLIASAMIRNGEYFSEKNLGMKRPGNGISPLRYWSFFRRKADRDYCENEIISE